MATEGTVPPQSDAPIPDPAAGQDPAASREQDINPWSVEGAQDESGQVAAIDYLNLSRCDSDPPFPLTSEILSLFGVERPSAQRSFPRSPLINARVACVES